MLILIIFGAIGIVMIGVFAYQIKTWFDIKYWAQTHATLLEARILFIDPPRSSNGEKRASYFKLDVEYEYSACGKKYKGKKITLSDNTTKTKKELNRLLDKCKNSTTLIVYYNPLRENQSVLFPEINRYIFSTLYIGIIFVAVPVVGWIILNN